MCVKQPNGLLTWVMATGLWMKKTGCFFLHKRTKAPSIEQMNFETKSEWTSFLKISFCCRCSNPHQAVSFQFPFSALLPLSYRTVPLGTKRRRGMAGRLGGKWRNETLWREGWWCGRENIPGTNWILTQLVPPPSNGFVFTLFRRLDLAGLDTDSLRLVGW